MLINSTDLKEWFPFSDNISERMVKTHIRDAQDIDLPPLFSDLLIANIKAEISPAVAAWNRNTTYAVGNIVEWQGEYFKATAINTNDQPDVSVNDWAECDLLNFWNDYIKPLMCALTMKRYTLWAGANYTQFGIRQNNDETSTEITTARRAELLQDIERKVNYYQMNAIKYLASVNNELDGVVYDLDNNDVVNPRPTFTIHVPSVHPLNKRRICPDDYGDNIYQF
jgi:hypothetical protein